MQQKKSMKEKLDLFNTVIKNQLNIKKSFQILFSIEKEYGRKLLTLNRRKEILTIEELLNFAKQLFGEYYESIIIKFFNKYDDFAIQYLKCMRDEPTFTEEALYTIKDTAIMMDIINKYMLGYITRIKYAVYSNTTILLNYDKNANILKKYNKYIYETHGENLIQKYKNGFNKMFILMIFFDDLLDNSFFQLFMKRIINDEQQALVNFMLPLLNINEENKTLLKSKIFLINLK